MISARDRRYATLAGLAGVTLPLPVASGGTGGTTQAGGRSGIGLGSASTHPHGDYDLAGAASTAQAAAIAASQPLDADLTAIAALATLTYGRGLLTLADAPALRSAVGLRVIANGSTVLTAGGAVVVDLATFTRTATELVWIVGFPSGNVAGLIFAPGVQAAIGITTWIERTANANEAKARALNTDITNARTLEWAVIGVTP